MLTTHINHIKKRHAITTTYYNNLTVTQLNHRPLSKQLIRLLEKATFLCRFHDDFADQANQWNETAVSYVNATLEELQHDFIVLKLSNEKNLVHDKFEYQYNLQTYIDETELSLTDNWWTRFRPINDSTEPVSGTAELAFLVLMETRNIEDVLRSVTDWIGHKTMDESRQIQQQGSQITTANEEVFPMTIRLRHEGLCKQGIIYTVII